MYMCVDWCDYVSVCVSVTGGMSVTVTNSVFMCVGVCLDEEC